MRLGINSSFQLLSTLGSDTKFRRKMFWGYINLWLKRGRYIGLGSSVKVWSKDESDYFFYIYLLYLSNLKYFDWSYILIELREHK